jgi:hypothetical protein
VVGVALFGLLVFGPTRLIIGDPELAIDRMRGRIKHYAVLHLPLALVSVWLICFALSLLR